MSNQAKANEKSWSTLGQPGRDFYRLNEQTVDMTRARLDIQPVRVAALPQEVIFDLRKTALIVVDMQKEFCSPRGWLSQLGLDVGGALKLIDPIKRTTDRLRSLGVPVIWVNWGVRPDRLNLSPGAQHTFNPTGCGAGLGDELRVKDSSGKVQSHHILQKGSWGAEVLDELAPADADIFVDKHRVSGFWDTPLDSILRNLGVRTVLFSGINADQCVYATLMDANFHGYDTLLLEDCTATTSPAFCLEATLYNVRFAYGFTLKSDDLLAQLPPR